MNRRDGRAGATLLEMLTSTFLLGILLASLGTVYYYTVAYFQMMDARTQVQTEVLKAVHKIVFQVQDSAWESTSIEGSSPEQSLTFASLMDSQDQRRLSNGELLWQSRRALQLDRASSRLLLVRQPLSTPTTQVPSSTNLTTLSTNSTSQVLAHHIVSLQFDPVTPTGGHGTRNLRLRLRCEIVKFRHTYWTQIESGCQLRNSQS